MGTHSPPHCKLDTASLWHDFPDVHLYPHSAIPSDQPIFAEPLSFQSAHPRHRQSLSSESESSLSEPPSPSRRPPSPSPVSSIPDPDASDAPWNLVAYHIPWGPGYEGYDAGTLPGPDGTCLFLRSPTPLKRQRTSQACEKCRERKAKCSGARPSCARCQARGLVCVYASSATADGSQSSPRPSSIRRLSLAASHPSLKTQQPKATARNRIRRACSFADGEADDAPQVKRSLTHGSDLTLQTHDLSATWDEQPYSFSAPLPTRTPTLQESTFSSMYADSMRKLEAYRFPPVEEVKHNPIAHPQPLPPDCHTSIQQLSHSLDSSALQDAGASFMMLNPSEYELTQSIESTWLPSGLVNEAPGPGPLTQFSYSSFTGGDSYGVPATYQSFSESSLSQSNFMGIQGHVHNRI